MIPKRSFALLLAAGTHVARHGKRTLLDHLMGTHEILREWGNGPEVCQAGLFHSIYGTNIYKHQSIGFSHRRHVRAVIGREAENLAFLFCTLKRPRALIAAANNKSLGKPLPTVLQPKGQLNKLLEIECANLIEQRSYSKNLFRIHQAAKNNSDLISPAALNAITSIVTHRKL